VKRIPVTQRIVAVVALVLGTAGAGLFVTAAPAMAAGTTRYVATTGTDTDNDCTDQTNPCQTIQYAVNQADSGDTVSIGSGTYDESVQIRTSLTLEGAGDSGSSKTTIDGDSDDDPSIWVDGLDVEDAIQVTIEDLDVSGNSDDDAIYAAGEAPGIGITILDCVVDDNNDDGIDLAGSVTASVTDTTVSGNDEEGVTTGELEADPPVATLTGDVIDRNDDGGVVSEEGSITINSTTLDHNTGAGVVSDGEGNSVTVDTTTVSSTVPFTDSDGPDFGSGVLVFPGGFGTIQSSTIFGNAGQGVLSLDGDVSIANSTISGTVVPPSIFEEIPVGGVAVSTAVPIVARKAMARFARPRGQFAKRKGAAIRPKVSAVESPSVTLTATITADNTTLPDCNGAVIDEGYNLASDDSCGFSAKGSINSGTAKLGPLADNGGPTETLLPAKGSDAIDAIPTTADSCTTPDADQRGVSRPQGPACDIGAVEAAQPPIVIAPKSLPDGEVGKHYSITLTATGGLGAPYEFSLAPDSGPLPPGLSISTAGAISGTPTKAGTYPIIVNVDDPARKHYTIVIKAPATPPSSSSPSPSPTKSTAPQGGTLPNTGGNVNLLATVGALLLGLGILLLGATGLLRRRRGYRQSH
jgi:hypothetical protein